MWGTSLRKFFANLNEAGCEPSCERFAFNCMDKPQETTRQVESLDAYILVGNVKLLGEDTVEMIR
ncbi:uncharacterized protein EAE97_010722 [Botrytis byssoidea]|uniref:Uncharacterized protein n=1 Tax=Botrytis byssoidea TaxID=139641 RepID=A0A9P5HZH7_9HELO|nr:uncharacterized protein EAE97_010722 [Botrytis byssoidea]KAF7924110.1 hypothetical protein EAE97_010722 [Botrytis byssoidea]